jgi:hypothetical protein
MALTYATTLEMLKQMFPPGTIPLIGYQKTPIQALIRKDTTGGGNGIKVPMSIAGGQTSTATFATTQTNASNYHSQDKAFTVTVMDKFANARIDHKVIKATRNDLASFGRALAKETQSTIKDFRKSREKQSLRSGNGALCVSTSYSTVSVTLPDPSLAHLFEIDMNIVFAASETAALRSATPSVITGVNTTTGVLTFSADVNSTSGYVNGDYLFVSGDVPTGGTAASGKMCIVGLAGWNPYTDPSGSESFFGVDRSVFRNRLAGTALNCSSDNIVDALIKLQSETACSGGTPTFCIMAPFQMRRLVSTLSDKCVYDQMMGRGPDDKLIANIGFSTVKVQGDQAPIQCISSPFAEYNYIRMIDPEVWVDWSMGDIPEITNAGGDGGTDVSNANQIEYRYAAYSQPYCSDQSTNGVALVSVQ